jgi:hypothetical protein
MHSWNFSRLVWELLLMIPSTFTYDSQVWASRLLNYIVMLSMMVFLVSLLTPRSPVRSSVDSVLAALLSLEQF